MSPDGTNLLPIDPILLPTDHPDTDARRAAGRGLDPTAVAAGYPASSWAWAILANAALTDDRPVAAYAYARTGYHRGLDALRRAGWRGRGPIPAEHEPNRGFLMSLLALARAAAAIGEEEEAHRCRTFLTESGVDLADPMVVRFLE